MIGGGGEDADQHDDDGEKKTNATNEATTPK